MVKEEDKNKKIFLVAQEIELAKLLAGNNKKVRDKALKNLKKWFFNRSQAIPFKEDDFQRIWKGLFYSMWMSDKPLIQEECAENIASLVHFPTYDLSTSFYKAGMMLLMNEWFGIDQLRLNKFLMLVRRLLRHMLMVIKEHGFSKDNIEKFNEVLTATVLSSEKVPLGLVMHFIEIFMEELAKVTGGNIHPDSVTEILRPFIRKLATTDDGRQIGHIRKFIFVYLIRQSDVGLDYQAKYDAWKQLGFPGSINSMQKIALDDDERKSTNEEEEDGNENNDKKPLDPRAGRVDVELPQIKFSAKKIVEVLCDNKFDKNSTKHGRNMINILSNQFTLLGNGKYPLGIKKTKIKENVNADINIRKAANKLIKFEQKLLNKNKKRKRENSGEATTEEPEETPKVKKQKLEHNRIPKESVAKSKEMKKKKSDEKSEEVKRKKKKLKTKLTEEICNNIDNVSESPNKELKTQNNTRSDISTSAPERKKLELLENNNNGNYIKSKSKKVTTDSTKIKPKIKNGTKKRKKLKSLLDSIECIFERNSGTWVVYDVSKETDEFSDTSDYDITPVNYITGNEESSITLEHKHDPELVEQSDPKKLNKLKVESSESSIDIILNDNPPNKLVSPDKLKKPIKLLESPPRGRALFPRTEWDEALQEGEYEVFVPTKKYLKKMQKIAKRNGQKDSQVLVTPSQNNQVKSRRSLDLDPSLIKNPFLLPGSTKKVKINTKLNRSQEIYEHHMQILSSPGIPHDPDKKPVKPVLKSPATTNSINPFYDKQLSVW